MHGLQGLLAAGILGYGLYRFVMAMDHAIWRFLAKKKTRPRVQLPRDLLRGNELDRRVMCEQREQVCKAQVEAFLRAETAWLEARQLNAKVR